MSPRQSSAVGGARSQWRHAAARERAAGVAEFQRSRVLRAAVEVASERGYTAMTAAAVIARAGVSRKTFYEVFDGCEDCFLAVLEECLAQMAAVAAPAYEGDGHWSERLRSALTAVLAFLEDERNGGALLLSYLGGYGPSRPELRTRVLQRLQGVVEDGRAQAGPPYEPPRLTAEAVVGGVLAVTHARLQRGPRQLMPLLNPLMWMIVLPYLGPAAAGKQLTRSPPKRIAPVEMTTVAASDPVRILNMRLTYRTARTLEAIELAPGASNAEICARVGITDPGQISKLLSRLAGVGLIENIGAGQPRGAANAWHLTDMGKELESAIRRRSVAPRRRRSR
jgi:AcrR family transcriptional regulator